MFRLRQHHDVHVDTTDTPGVLDVRRVAGGDPRWSCRLDVAAAYAERLTTPEVFAIDARLGAHGEVYLIAHAFEQATRKLLPPREFSLADGQLARTRPGADRHALEANEHVIAGGIHWQVTDETATTFTLVGGVRTIEKSEATGPFLRLARYHDWTIRIVQELDDHLLAVIAGDAARELGWSTGMTPGSRDFGFRWFERNELGPLARPVVDKACPICATAKGEHAPGFNTIAVERAEEQDQRLVACCACNRVWMIAQTGDGWTWSRVDENADEEPARRLVSSRVPSTEELDRYACVEISGRRIATDDESAESWSFAIQSSNDDPELVAAGLRREGNRDDRMGAPVYEYIGQLDKLDHRITGPFLYCVRFAGRVLRAIEEDADAVLLVCQSGWLASELEFERRERVAFRWVKKADVEVLRVPRDTVTPTRPALPVRPPTPFYKPSLSPEHARTSGKAPTDERLAEYRYLEIAGYRPEIIVESADTWTASIERDGADHGLQAAGFTLQPDEPDAIIPRYRYLAELDKLDPRVTGPFHGCVRFADHTVRAIEDDGDRLLLICHSTIGEAVDFHPRERVWFRWVLKNGLQVIDVKRDKRLDIDDTPLIDAVRTARQNAVVTFAGTQLDVQLETATTLVLHLESDYAHDDLVALGFTREQHTSDLDASGRKMNLYYEGLRDYYTFRGVVPKLDPRLTGPFLH